MVERERERGVSFPNEVTEIIESPSIHPPPRRVNRANELIIEGEWGDGFIFIRDSYMTQVEEIINEREISQKVHFLTKNTTKVYFTTENTTWLGFNWSLNETPIQSGI